jgi:hypothetical protein
VLKRIYGAKILYSSPKDDQMKENLTGWTRSTHGELRNAYKILIGRPK